MRLTVMIESRTNAVIAEATKKLETLELTLRLLEQHLTRILKAAVQQARR